MPHSIQQVAVHLHSCVVNRHPLYEANQANYKLLLFPPNYLTTFLAGMQNVSGMTRRVNYPLNMQLASAAKLTDGNVYWLYSAVLNGDCKVCNFHDCSLRRKTDKSKNVLTELHN